MKIRKARKEDLNQIVILYTSYIKYIIKFAKWLDSKIKIDKDAINEIRLGIKKSLNKKEHIFLVAEENGRIIGFVHAELMSYRESRTKNKIIVDIVDIYSNTKRKGIGRLLLKEIEKWAKKNKADYIFWEYITDNKIAENFCKKNKFKGFKTKMIKKLK